MASGEQEREERVLAWLRERARLEQPTWLESGTCWLDLSGAGRLRSSAGGVALDAVESVQLSRWDRPLPRSWLSRLLRRPAPRRPSVGARLRSAREERLALCADCDDEALLERLPWEALDAPRVPLEGLIATVVLLVEDGRPLRLGPLGPRPEVSAEASTHPLLERARAQPGLDAWERFCEGADACDDDTLARLKTPILRALSKVWLPELRNPPRRWLEAFLAGREEPRMAFAVVTQVSFADAPLDAGRLLARLDAPELSGLVQLRLSRCELFEDGLMELLSSTRFHGIRALHLNDNGLDVDALAAFLEAGPHPQLNELTWSGEGLGPEGGALLGERGAEALPALRSLDLSSNALLPEGAMSVARFLEQSGLERLGLWGNRLGEAGLEALADASRWPGSLMSLSLGLNFIDEDVAAAFVAVARERGVHVEL